MTRAVARLTRSLRLPDTATFTGYLRAVYALTTCAGAPAGCVVLTRRRRRATGLHVVRADRYGADGEHAAAYRIFGGDPAAHHPDAVLLESLGVHLR